MVLTYSRSFDALHDCSHLRKIKLVYSERMNVKIEGVTYQEDLALHFEHMYSEAVAAVLPLAGIVYLQGRAAPVRSLDMCFSEWKSSAHEYINWRRMKRLGGAALFRCNRTRQIRVASLASMSAV